MTILPVKMRRSIKYHNQQHQVSEDAFIPSAQLSRSTLPSMESPEKSRGFKQWQGFWGRSTKRPCVDRFDSFLCEKSIAPRIQLWDSYLVPLILPQEVVSFPFRETAVRPSPSSNPSFIRLLTSSAVRALLKRPNSSIMPLTG